MSFAVNLLTDTAQVEPGTSVPMIVEVVNHGEAEDHYELSVEGLDPEWTAVPVPTFALEPGSDRSERIFLKPPRDSDSTAGSYPFVVRVRSLESGEAKSMQGMLEIKSFTHLAIDVSPRRSQVSLFRQDAAFTVIASNLGNTEQALQLFANDTEDAFAYEFEMNQVSLAPGSSRDVHFRASSTSKSLFARTRLHQVSVTGRSVANPAVAASASAQIEQRALMTPMSFVAAMVFAIIAMAWVLLLPKPPDVEYLRLSTDRATVNDQVVIRWKATNASGVVLTIGNKTIETDPVGERTETFTTAGEVPVTIHAVRDDRKSEEVVRRLVIVPRTEAPLPEILEFVIKPSKVRFGDTFLVAYKFGPSVTEAILQPVNIKLDLATDQVQVRADMQGTVVYKLIARNADGKTVDKSVTMNILQESRAQILKFKATPVEIDSFNNRVTIEWECAQTTKLQLQSGDQTLELDPTKGKQDITVLKATTLILTATDAEGLATQQKIDIKMKNPESTPLTGGDVGHPTTTTTGTGG
ncbi:MAG: hypothetical protein KF857_10615 [Fimbriimonadaceae bacterium]|nr:hypothetical protein [Fimbriimonadaceae bacterium]